MARYTGSVCKLCRRENMKMFLKGERCYTDRCAMERRPYPPGDHGQGRQKKPSDFALQLREKQKVRRMYGLLEKQFKNYFRKAERMKGVTGENLLMLLERRLDNVVYRLCFGTTRADARQLVRHRHVKVNGKRVDIPSYRVQPGQKIEIREKSKNNPQIQRAMELTNQTGIVEWVDVDKDKLFGIFTRIPEREEISIPVEERLIVELYSK